MWEETKPALICNLLAVHDVDLSFLHFGYTLSLKIVDGAVLA